jgi:hypothetical protein
MFLSLSAIDCLASGGNVSWDDVEQELERSRKFLFFGQQARSWWLKLEGQIQHARALATGDDAKPLRAAYILRALVPPSPLGRKPARPRVFVKTFKEYTRKVVAEIRRCSTKAPDFGRDRLQVMSPSDEQTLILNEWGFMMSMQCSDQDIYFQQHPSLSAIYGGSHSGSLRFPERQVDELSRLAFVALENCEGQVRTLAKLHMSGSKTSKS